MKLKTLQDKRCFLLGTWGFKEEVSKTRKYRVFTHDALDTKIFIGRKGAVRKGKNASSSYSVFGGNAEKAMAFLSQFAK